MNLKPLQDINERMDALNTCFPVRPVHGQPYVQHTQKPQTPVYTAPPTTHNCRVPAESWANELQAELVRYSSIYHAMFKNQCINKPHP